MKYKHVILVVFAGLLLLPGLCIGAEGDGAAEGSAAIGTMPSVTDVLEVISKATTPKDASEGETWSGPIKMVIVFGALAIVPSLLIMTTSFTRIVIVLSFARRALGTQTIPPNTAIIGLAMFLTLFTMAPTFSKINEEAIGPYMADEIEFGAVLDITSVEMKGFMLRQTRESDLGLFVEMSGTAAVASSDELPLHVVIPSFIISEFRTAFEIGCLLFIPFLLIDLVTASILLSAGMMMLPPVMISLPFKLILFVLVDGWALLAKSLSLSFG